MESFDLRSPRGERIDLGQPITAVRPDGVSPGRVGFRVFKSARRIVLRIALPVSLLRRRVLRIALDAEGTRDVFMCQHKGRRTKEVRMLHNTRYKVIVRVNLTYQSNIYERKIFIRAGRPDGPAGALGRRCEKPHTPIAGIHPAERQTNNHFLVQTPVFG